MIYKVSYVVIGSEHPGAILNQEVPPVPGNTVKLGQNTFEVIEVTDLIPPRGDFAYLHATVRLVNAGDAA
ncbi:MAG: hypothetical protein JXD18_08100 [Anaerolineae bacterium]|nr:hypothetical protein [Anaerolineae bacterium]